VIYFGGKQSCPLILDIGFRDGGGEKSFSFIRVSLGYCAIKFKRDLRES
jgi:hypothetical protein